MDDTLQNIVLQRLERFPLAEQATSLLLSALDGDEALATELDTERGTGRTEHGRAGQPGEPPAEPVGAYLKSLTVSGFRGIGPAATLKVPPGPGLTLVVGRNGSGKSSFAEALELLLTGTLLRWDSAKSTVFRNGWQSKHADTGTAIRAETLVEGKGMICAERIWAPGTGLADSAAWLQANGEKRQPGLDGLGWAGALKTYRPFLSHAELETFFGTPSELYDLLASVLGLEDLTAAANRLNTARKERDDELGAVKKRLDALLERLRELDDDRARDCHAALSGKIWDIPVARETATGGGQPSGQLGTLRQMERLVSPPDSDVDAAVTALRSAADGLEAAAGSSADQARQLADLLDAALRHHQSHGDGDCPVCGQSGALTRQWQEETRRHVARLREEARAAEAAITDARKASGQALALIQPPPPVLGEDVEGIDVEPARVAWRAWAKPPADADPASPAGLRDLAEHIATTGTALKKAIATLTAASSTELSRRDDKWAPLAAEVTSWCAEAEKAQRANQPVKALKDAKQWLTTATGSATRRSVERACRTCPAIHTIVRGFAWQRVATLRS